MSLQQKIVIKVQINCNKCRSKAMRLVASAEGVDSVAVEGEDKDHLVLVGDGVDPADLTCTLRKKVGHAYIVKVEEVKAKTEPEKPPPVVNAVAVGLPCYSNCPPCPPVVFYEHGCSTPSPYSCPIM
ncbi:unnamed protein product [Musa textilis]